MEFNQEINQAIRARQSGNEGMARVCARRAAGIVIGEYLTRHGHANLTQRAIERLMLFTQLPEVDQSYKTIADHCLMKVNQKHELPIGVDLIGEVIWLEKSLFFDDQN